MKPLFILKIGGSVVTYKNRPGVSVRKELLRKIVLNIKKAQRKGLFNLVIIHGAGAAGHQLAEKYDLAEGVRMSPKKWHGAVVSRLANHKLNSAILETLICQGLRVTTVHTATAIIQNNKRISYRNLGIIKKALRDGCIPLLYGELVFDTRLGMSICSGDAIVSYLAKKLGAQKIFFASDIDGIFTRDPHVYKNAELLEKIRLKGIFKKAHLSESHNVDVTGGLFGKIKSLDIEGNESLKTVEIFNGLDEKNYSRALLGKKFSHTVIVS